MKSRQRVVDHGEVFTPSWLVDAMLDLVKQEFERIDSRILEPACGSGNFLVPALRRKLASVQLLYGRSPFEARHHALLGLMCLYGIELLEDNVEECRENLLNEFADVVGAELGGVLYLAARNVLAVNIVHGDALTLRAPNNEYIIFAEWAYRGKGKYQRRDFRFRDLIQMSSFNEETLFAGQDKHDIFLPIMDYPAMTVKQIAEMQND